MRIIFWLEAGVGLAAMGTAAAARPAGAFNGQSGGLQVGGSKSGGHHAGRGGHTRLGPGMIGNDRRHGRHHGRSGRQDFRSYAAGGIAGPIGAVDPWGNGFFSGGGGQIRVRGGRPQYDYDRAYPYEWASGAGGRQASAEEDRATEFRSRCTFENGVRVCRGW